MLKYLHTICLAVLLPTMVDAQAISVKHTFNIELGLPNSFANKPFKSFMQGLVSFEPYYQYKFEKNLVTGIGLKYNYFTVNQFKVPTKVIGGMHTGGIFLKAGWEKFHSDRFATDFGIKIGYTENYFGVDHDDTLGLGRQWYRVNSTYFEPTIGFILTADETASYRFIVSYAFQGFGFKPGMLGFETFPGYDPKEYDKLTSYLIIGFGYTHYFVKKNQ